MGQILFDGKILVEPQAAGKFSVGTAPKANPLAAGNIMLIGESEGGKPNELMWFTNPIDAKDVLRSGDVLREIDLAFNPSGQEEGAPNLGFIRAQVAVQSELDIGSVILPSRDYGTYVNNYEGKVETGTESDTSKLSIQYGDTLETWDNLGLALSIQYIGSSVDGLIEVTAADHIIGTHGDTGAENESFDFDMTLSDYSTLSKLISAINNVADWTCTVYGKAPTGIGSLSSTVLNTLAAVTCKSAELPLQAYPHITVHVVNNESALSGAAVDVAGDGVQITNTTGFEAFTGGLAPAMANSDVIAALSVMEEANGQIIIIDSDDAAHHALIVAHCKDNQFWREGVFGGELKTTETLAIDDVETRAIDLNSAHGSVVFGGIYNFNESGSGLELLVPKFFAAQVAGLIAGQPPIEPITHKVFSCKGLQFDLKKDKRERLIKAGVIVPRFYEGIGYIINQGVNTLQNNINLWDVNSNSSPEISLNRAAGVFVKELVVAADKQFIGGVAGIGRGVVVSFIQSYCITKEQDGTIAENDADLENILPAWENIIVDRLEAGWKTKVSIRLNSPMNYFLIEVVAIL